MRRQAAGARDLFRGTKRNEWGMASCREEAFSRKETVEAATRQMKRRHRRVTEKPELACKLLG
jgi:hypothetical protein